MSEDVWVAWRSDRPDDADAGAEVRDEEDRPAGVLVAWRDGRRPDDAVRVDPRAIDPAGAAALASIALAPPGVSFDFDEPAVVAATRAVMTLRPADIVTTAIAGNMRFAGAITALRDGDRTRLEDDPFARIVPGRIVRVGPGLLGTMPPPIGPGTQRYGAGNPWPWDRFRSGGGID